MEQIVEGLVQGLTEFLPISSSGHVVFLEMSLCTDIVRHQERSVALNRQESSHFFGLFDVQVRGREPYKKDNSHSFCLLNQ